MNLVGQLASLHGQCPRKGSHSKAGGSSITGYTPVHIHLIPILLWRTIGIPNFTSLIMMRKASAHSSPFPFFTFSYIKVTKTEFLRNTIITFWLVNGTKLYMRIHSQSVILATVKHKTMLHSHLSNSSVTFRTQVPFTRIIFLKALLHVPLWAAQMLTNVSVSLNLEQPLLKANNLLCLPPA